MFYISNKKENTWGVTCTDNDITKFFTEQELLLLVNRDGMKIYGLEVYDNKVTCTKLRPLESGSESELRKRLNSWRELHNPWTERPVENYLAMLPVNTIVRVDYTDYREAHTYHSRMRIMKHGVDTWSAHDDNNIMYNNRTGDSQFALKCLESSYIYSDKIDRFWLIKGE